jgi:filamentous hemagglutinin
VPVRSKVTTALVGGVAGQGAGQVASNALAPYAAYFIGSKLDPSHGSDPNATLQFLSHTVLGALLAEANGGSAGTGAVSATGGELAAKVLTNSLTGGNPAKLSPEQKEVALALSHAVGVTAGGLLAQDLAGITLNAGIAKNSVENNFLAEDQARAMKQQLDECGSDTSCQKTVRDVVKQLSERMDYGLLSVCSANSSSPACQAFVNAAVSYKYGSWPGMLGLFDELGHSSEALSSFGHSLNGRAYRELIFENGGLQPVYILPQEYTVAALAQWTAGVDTSIDQYGLWSKETAGEVGLGLAQLLARRYGMVNIVGGNGGFGSGRSNGTPNTSSGTQVDAEKSALERIAGRPAGPDLSLKQPESVLQAYSQKRIDDLAHQYNSKSLDPKDFQLNLGSKVLKADAQVSTGAPVYIGASTSDVMLYFRQLTGTDRMPVAKVVPGKGLLYTATTSSGAKITLRDFSTSAQKTGASWTIDVQDKSINNGKRVEVKFK